jgi:hypothetical protein
MNTLTSKLVLSAIGFGLTLLSGLVLSNLGRPLNSLVFTLHKLIAVATLILIGLNMFNLIRAVDVRAFYLVLVALTGLLFLALVVSGAFLSFERPLPQLALRVHQIAPLLALAAAGLSLILLVSHRVEVLQ